MHYHMENFLSKTPWYFSFSYLVMNNRIYSQKGGFKRKWILLARNYGAGPGISAQMRAIPRKGNPIGNPIFQGLCESRAQCPTHTCCSPSRYYSIINVKKSIIIKNKTFSSKPHSYFFVWAASKLSSYHFYVFKMSNPWWYKY